MTGRRPLRRLVPPAAVALLTVTLAACGGASTSGTATTGNPRFRGIPVADAQRAPDFALRDQSGRLVRLSQLRGRFVVVSFLFTHCPDVCPLIANELGDALRQLGPARAGVRMLAVSVDPAHDTPASVRAFIAAHRLPPQFRYLTGTRRELAPVWAAYHVGVDPLRKQQIAHSAFEVLVDRSGTERLVYDTQVRARDVVHDIHALEAGS
jgi:protein SCO1/2